MKRLKQILVSAFILILIATVCTISQAFDVYREDAAGAIVGHMFYPNTNFPGGTWFCIQPGGEFHVNELMTQGENASYPAGSYIPQSGNYECTKCNPYLESYIPWGNGTHYFYRYTQGETFSWFQYPDAAYVLAEMTERGSLISWDTAYGIWNSRVSSPKRIGSYEIIGESQAYATFYQLIHGGLTTNDIFETLIKDNSKDIKIGVNQEEGYYEVGPFNISYPDGVYEGINKFSWIEDMKAVTNAGTLPVTILLGNRQEISLSDLGEKGTQTLNNKDFYIRFYSTEALEVSLQVRFGYVEHCDATMTQYTGIRVYRDWNKQVSGQHNHPTPGKKDPVTGHRGPQKDHYYPRRRYQAFDREGSDSQTLMALSGTATKVRKTVEKVFPGADNPPPTTTTKIDLTMKLAGTVFIDQDTGKVNEGNNKLDGDEGLAGVEVYLHQVDAGVIAKTLTDSEGNYIFEKLNAQKQYYIEFVYNGMLYTNVERLQGNAVDISKATEEAQGHNGNRQAFNDKFKEIGSYPNNYKSPSRGGYNQVFLQEEIADTFKTIANNYGSHGNSDKEVYAYDCRISAYSTEIYPLTKIFTIDDFGNVIAGKHYDAIYQAGGPYDQLHINLGIKARPTFDLALYKDILKATLNINGKQEVYTYDARTDWQNNGFSYGVNEDYYLNQLREKYMNGTDTNITTKERIDEGEYVHEYRTEEIINGNNTNENYKSWLQDNKEYEKTLYGDDSNKQYAWRDINHNVTESDKLQIHVTYKLAIRNQSRVVGAITELVDYYDSHYQFEGAYVGDKDGNKTGEVEASGTSMYGEATRISGATGTWKTGVKQETTNYKTIYLRPKEEQKLYKDHIDQYIYVTLGLINPENTLIEAGLPQGNRFYTYNMAEINGYKTYGTFDDGPSVTASMGLVDRDSNPGNFNPSTYVYGETKIEDDESRAPAYAYTIRNSRTLEGNVFEDILAKNATGSKEEYEVKAKTTRFGNGTIDEKDKKIQGIKVELVEVKNGQLVSRQTTYTDEKGWYGFGAFLPGDYTIRFTYGAEDKTALTKTSQYTQGLNDTSYNGQDYQSTIFTPQQAETATPHNYTVDDTLKGIYTTNNQAKNNEEHEVTVGNQVITKYDRDGYYWFDDETIANRSDAADDKARRDQVTAYSKSEYGREITNHKAEVFNSYINQETLRGQESTQNNFDKFTQAQPMDKDVDKQDKNRNLVNELERRTYMYAYTPEIPVEVEYTVKQIPGNQTSDKYTYKITGVDFGVVERARSQLTIDQDIDYVKVTASDGTTLLELQHEETGKKFKVIVNNGDNYMLTKISDFSQYDKEELLNIILDDELLSGSKLEVRYKITVTNNSEVCTGIANTLNTTNTTRAKTIINYVANNLNFDLADNNGLWEVVKKEDIQTGSHSTWINNERVNDRNLIDLSTQTTVLKATDQNPLTKKLEPGESTTSTLTLKKTLSAESSADDLKYCNMSEIVEIDNQYGRYDRGAIPGNQSLEEQPREHDASGASRYDEIDDNGKKTPYPPDIQIIITPPTGETPRYYVLGAIAVVILAVGVFLIKKFVIDGKKE